MEEKCPDCNNEECSCGMPAGDAADKSMDDAADDTAE